MENKVIKREQVLDNTKLKYSGLVDNYKEIIDFVNSIPPDLYNDLMAKYQELQETSQDLGWDMEMY